MNNRLLHDKLPLAEVVITLVLVTLLWCMPLF